MTDITTYEILTTAGETVSFGAEAAAWRYYDSHACDAIVRVVTYPGGARVLSEI